MRLLFRPLAVFSNLRIKQFKTSSKSPAYLHLSKKTARAAKSAASAPQTPGQDLQALRPMLGNRISGSTPTLIAQALAGQRQPGQTSGPAPTGHVSGLTQQVQTQTQPAQRQPQSQPQQPATRAGQPDAGAPAAGDGPSGSGGIGIGPASRRRHAHRHH